MLFVWATMYMLGRVGGPVPLLLLHHLLLPYPLLPAAFLGVCVRFTNQACLCVCVFFISIARTNRLNNEKTSAFRAGNKRTNASLRSRPFDEGSVKYTRLQ